MLHFTIDQNRCTACGLCSGDCPIKIIDGRGDFPQIKDGREKMCMECQHCLAICPTGALSILDKNPEKSAPVITKFTGVADVAQLIKGRRSVREFKSENLDKELISMLLNSAAYAPTSKNENSVQFTIVDNSDDMEVFRSRIYDALKEESDAGNLGEKLAVFDSFQKLWHTKGVDVLFRGAPHLVIATAPADAVNPVVDSVISLSYFELVANAHGVGTLWDGFAKIVIQQILGDIKERFAVPEGHVVGEVMLFGYSKKKYARAIQANPASVTRFSR